MSLALCFLLIWKRHQFTAIGDLRNRWRALRVCALFLGSGFVLGFAEIAVRVNRLVGDPGVVKWAEHAALGLIGISGPVRFQYPMGASAVADLLHLLEALLLEGLVPHREHLVGQEDVGVDVDGDGEAEP